MSVISNLKIKYTGCVASNVTYTDGSSPYSVNTDVYGVFMPGTASGGRGRDVLIHPGDETQYVFSDQAHRVFLTRDTRCRLKGTCQFDVSPNATYEETVPSSSNVYMYIDLIVSNNGLATGDGNYCLYSHYFCVGKGTSVKFDIPDFGRFTVPTSRTLWFKIGAASGTYPEIPVTSNCHFDIVCDD